MPTAAPTSPTRVAHLIGQLSTGGIEKLLVEFYRHCDRERFELTFISLSGGGAAADELSELGAPVVLLNQPDRLVVGLSGQLAALLRERRIRILHTHNQRPLIYGSRAGRKAGIPVIHTRHGRHPGRSRRLVLLNRLALRGVARVVCVSDDIAALATSEGVPEAKLQTIHNGIDLSRFMPFQPNSRGPLLFYGRLSPEKNLPMLLRAVAQLRAAHPAVRLEIGGDGPRRSELQSLIDKLGLADNVILLGPLADVRSALARAAMFVLPSMTEGISLALLEAAASGLPIVATRVGGNAEIVDDGQTGLLVDSNNDSAMAGAIERLMSDRTTAAQMGAKGRARAEQHFDVRQMVRAYEELYRHL